MPAMKPYGAKTTGRMGNRPPPAPKPPKKKGK